MYFRDEKITLKPNDNFTTKRGFLYCYLDGQNYKINVINVLDEQNDDGLDLHQLYNKYSKLIEKDNYVAIMEYFEIDQNGQDADFHLGCVQNQLRYINSQIKPKWNSETKQVL